MLITKESKALTCALVLAVGGCLATGLRAEEKKLPDKKLSLQKSQSMQEKIDNSRTQNIRSNFTNQEEIDKICLLKRKAFQQANPDSDLAKKCFKQCTGSGNWPSSRECKISPLSSSKPSAFETKKSS